MEAIEWLWSVWLQQSGGILADDMGLGKTLTCAAFISGLLATKRVRRVLVIAPKTLLAHWRAELAVVGLAKATFEYGGTAAQRRNELAAAHGTPSVLLATYGMVLHNKDELLRCVPGCCYSPFPVLSR